MNLPGRFIELSEAYGSDRARWPSQEHALYDLWCHTQDGANLLAQQVQLDQILDQWSVIDRSDAISAAVMLVAQPASLLALPTWFGQGLAAAILCGLLGGAGLSPSPDAAEVAEIAEIAVEIDSLALGDYLYLDNNQR